MEGSTMQVKNPMVEYVNPAMKMKSRQAFHAIVVQRPSRHFDRSRKIPVVRFSDEL